MICFPSRWKVSIYLWILETIMFYCKVLQTSKTSVQDLFFLNKNDMVFFKCSLFLFWNLGYEVAIFGLSTWNRIALLIAGHVFVKNRIFQQNTHWRCHRRNLKCNAKASTCIVNGVNVITNSQLEHNHS